VKARALIGLKQQLSQQPDVTFVVFSEQNIYRYHFAPHESIARLRRRVNDGRASHARWACSERGFYRATSVVEGKNGKPERANLASTDTVHELATDKPGDLNGSTQHLARTRLASETKA
jgi:hypothetical protein